MTIEEEKVELMKMFAWIGGREELAVGGEAETASVEFRKVRRWTK